MAAEPIEKQEITSACTVDLTGIIVQLHEKALNEIKDSEYIVQNSAIDGEGKDAKFYGAGNHIIAAIPKENKGLDKNKIPKKKALEILQTYLQWFVGPDLKSSLKETDLIPLENEDSGAVEDTHKKKEDIQKSKKDTAAGEKYEESTEIKIPSFSEFLLLEAGEDEAGTDADASGDSAAGDQEANSETGDSDPESSGSDGEDESASGYYVAYQLDIKGQPSHPIADALKKMGADLLKGFGISVGSWRNGSSGEVHTLGDLANALADVFGKIDPKELEAKAQEKFRDDFKDSDVQVKIFDTATIVSHLSKQLAGSDKSKIKSAEMALTAKVSKKDKSYNLFNKQAVADTVTKSISGIFKKFKNKLTKNDVILVNNYSDNKKRKEDVKYTEKGEGAVEDSLDRCFAGSMLNEAMLVKPKDADEALKKLVSSLPKEWNATSHVDTTDKIIGLLKVAHIDEAQWFDHLKETSKNAFMISVEAPLHESQTTDVNLLSFLFEQELQQKTKTTDKIKNVFSKFLLSFKDRLPKGQTLKLDEVNSMIGHVAEDIDAKDLAQATNDSQIRTYEMLSHIFEDMSFEDYDIIFEKDKKALDNTKYEILKKQLQANLEEIRKQKDKIIEKSYKNKDSSQMLTWTTDPEEAKNNGYTDFINTIFSDKSIDDVIKTLNKVCHRQNFRNDIVYRFSDAIKDIQPSEPKKEIVKVNFYDADPETGEKLDTPLNDKPFEVEKGTKLTSVQEINDAVAEYNKKLDAAPKDGYIRPQGNPWNPPLNDAIAETDPTEVISKYIKEKDKDKTYTVVLQYAPDQSAPDKTEIIEVDGKEDQKVKAGEAAKRPEKMPEIEGYTYKDFGDDEEALNNVQDDIVAVAQYIKNIQIIPSFPKDPAKPNELEKQDPIDYDPKKPLEEQLPKHPKHEGWEPDGWDPDPSTVKNPTDDIEITGKYKKAGSAIRTYYVIPDENKLLEDNDTMKIVFITTDPQKPEDTKYWKQIEGTEISDIDGISYPDATKLNIPDGYTFGGWSIPKNKLTTDSIKKYAADNNNIVKDKSINDGKPTVAIKALFVKAEFEINIISPDPEDPDNTASQEKLATIKVINGKYTVDDLKAAAKAEKSKDKSEKYAEAAKANEEAFKKVDNIKELEDKKKPYKFLGWTTDENDPDTPTYEKTTIQDTIAQVMAGPLPDEAVILRAVWSNDIKASHTELDFYIVPMKGLGDKKRFNSQTGRTEDASGK